MKEIKVMSIIGIIYVSFSLILLFIAEYTSRKTTVKFAIYFTVIGVVYSIVYSIVTLVASTKAENTKPIDTCIDVKDQLIKLNDLKEKEIISEQEFNQIKINYLNKLYYR